MKRIISVLVFFAVFMTAVDGQTKAIYFEALGASNVAGVNYDARFNGHSGLGYRIGLGYAFGFEYSDFFGGYNYSMHGLAVPVALNYLYGERKSQFELGVGMSNGIYRQTFRNSAHTYYDPDGKAVSVPETKVKDTGYGYFFFSDLGYRHTSARGFLFRIGISPSFTFSSSHSIEKSFFYPYLGIGYAF